MPRPALASDAEREACVARLRDAAAEGRLDVIELDERIGVAYRARTRLELATLTADLPQPPATRERRSGLRRRKAGSRRGLVACGAAANVTLLSLWMADVGAMRDPVILGITQFDVPWPVIPLAAWCSALAATAWRRRRAEQAMPDAPIAIG